MTDTKNHSTAGVTGSPEGRVFQPGSFNELAEAVELAFDYRGDVTVSLKSGESISGYLFNRQVSGPDSYLEIFLHPPIIISLHLRNFIENDFSKCLKMGLSSRLVCPHFVDNR